MGDENNYAVTVRDVTKKATAKRWCGGNSHTRSRTKKEETNRAETGARANGTNYFNESRSGSQDAVVA